MRPIDLTLDGFRSYAEAVTFSWEERRLVGIVGPIGSGKSTILDGIAFALYGKTPRIERNVRSLINQRRDEGKVALTFEIDGERWRAVRALRRKGAAAHTLYRMVEGEPVEEVDRAREMDQRVAELLGLDWDAFRRSVLLAQNQFAQFLEATPTERNTVLKGVFAFEDLDTMREVVRAWMDDAARDLARLATLREQAASDREALAEARRRHQEIAARAAGLDAAAEKVAAADRCRRAAEEAREAAVRERERLDRLAGSLPERRRVEALVERANEVGALLAAAEKDLDAARERAAAARSAREAALAAAGGREALEEAGRLMVAREGEQRVAAEAARRSTGAAAEAKEADGVVRAAEQAAVESVAAAVAAEEALEAAAVELGERRQRLHQARHGEMAATLRADLTVGEPCPVCAQTVSEVPAGAIPRDVAAAQQAEEAAREAETAAREMVSEASAAVAGARTRAEEAANARDRAQRVAAEAADRAEAAAAAVARIDGRLQEILGDGDLPSLLERRRGAVADADAALTAADDAVTNAVERREVADRDGRATLEDLGSLATELARIAGQLDVEVEVRAEPASVDAALRRIRDTWVDASRLAGESAERALAEAEEAADERAALLGEVGLEPDADLGAALTGARAELAGAAARIDLLEGRLADLDALEREEGEKVARHGTLQRLHGDLAPSKFQAFVLDEYRRALADLGSEQFEVLSGGRYRFSRDGEFEVVDLMAAEQTRSADSLSGGETFLASLALALALAEMVARQGGRLDAFFLDEGFGSLDAEHLDLAMEGIERLVAGADRLVVVVSHVAAMQDRVEDLIRLDKDPLTGVTRVRSGTGR